MSQPKRAIVYMDDSGTIHRFEHPALNNLDYDGASKLVEALNGITIIPFKLHLENIPFFMQKEDKVK